MDAVFDLIKQAIRQYYTEQDWLIIQLKNSWTREGEYRVSFRDMLQLNEYATIEIIKYLKDPVVQVYVGASYNPKKRPIWLSTDITPDSHLSVIKHKIHDLLDKVNYEVAKIRMDYITIVAKDVTNQLSN